MDRFTNEQALLDDKNQIKHRILRRENLSICGLKICYTLSETESASFLISVFGATECESVFVCGKQRANEFFELIVRNTVTPCTLHDVFEDVFE